MSYHLEFIYNQNEVKFPLLEPTPVRSASKFLAKVEHGLEHPSMIFGCRMDSLKLAPSFDKGARNQLYHFHAWTHIGTLLLAYRYSNDPKFITLARSQAESWVLYSNYVAMDQAPLNTEESFLWYDMAVGLRIYKLAYLVRKTSLDKRRLGTGRILCNSLSEHFSWFSTKRNFNQRTNHGVYQLAGLISGIDLAFSQKSPFDRDSLEDRLKTVLERQFSSEGCHLEHSPGYHFYLTYFLKLVISGGVFVRHKFWAESLVEKAEGILSLMTCPDGRLLTVGDTNVQRIPKRLEEIEWQDADLCTENGNIRPEPAAPRTILKQAGYSFIVRSVDKPRSSYVALNHGHHSRTHKQADNLSIFWQEGNDRILDDPGGYLPLGRTNPKSDLFKDGFWYSDPWRVYAESTYAHNTITVDNANHVRMMKVPPGGALVRDISLPSIDQLSALYRHPRFSHYRHIQFVAGKLLVITDRIYSWPGAAAAISQNFLLGPNWRPCGCHFISRETGAALYFHQFDKDAIRTSLSLGETVPRLKGWITYDLPDPEPAPAFEFQARARQKTTFQTAIIYDRNHVNGKDPPFRVRGSTIELDDARYDVPGAR